MNQDIWIWIVIIATIVLAICWLRGMSKLHKGVNRIFCAIPEPEKK